MAFTFYDLDRPFYVYSIIPRKKILLDDQINYYEFPLALVIEQDEEAPDPVDYFSTDTKVI